MTRTSLNWSAGARRLRTKRGWYAAAVLLLAACAPPMEPLSESKLEAAQQRWEASGPASYHILVRIRAPRIAPALYDVVVAERRLDTVRRNGEALAPDDAERHDYSMPGLFDLLREDLRLIDASASGQTPPLDLRVEFDTETGRLLKYRRTVGAARRRVLWVEVLEYEPLAPGTRVAGG